MREKKSMDNEKRKGALCYRSSYIKSVFV